MGSNPINLALRFLLEICALIAVGKWAFGLTEKWPKYIFAVAAPLILAVIWGTFAVADDPSRSGGAPVPVSGITRLFIELSFFGIASWVLYDMQHSKLSLTFLLVVLFHYLVSYDRILWLWGQ